MAGKTKRKAKRMAKKKRSRMSIKPGKAVRKTGKAKKTAKRAIAKKRATRKPVRKARRQPVPSPAQLAPSGVPELVPSALEQE